MTITDLIPALKGHGRRRAVDEVDRLRENEVILLRNLHGTGDAIALLRQDLANAHTREVEKEELVVKLQADLDKATEECNELRDQLAALRLRFGPQLAAEANANAVTVPLMVRDTSDPADQATAPIDVKPLWQALGIGPVLDPGRTH